GEVNMKGESVADEETVVVSTVEGLTDLIAATPTRLFELACRRSDADGDAESGEIEDGAPQAFAIKVRVSEAPEHLTVRVQVETDNPEGRIELDMGMQFIWKRPVTAPEDIVGAFASSVAIPHAMVNARVAMDNAAQTIGISSASIPFDFSRSGAFEGDSE
ncbi:MAG: hypothetical protein ABS976_24255, partial [Rhodococcus sp. (in: high G+C Gram-positive bacteria)]